MVCPPLRASPFGSDAEGGGSAIPTVGRDVGAGPVTRKHAGWVDDVGETSYRLERTTPTA